MPNNDYIKRSDLLDFLQMIPIDLGYREIKDVKEYVRNAPAANVEPKRYAEWISPDGISVWSNCGKAAPYDVEGDIIMYWPGLNFCPYCGCRMNVEGKNAEVH